MIDAPTVISVIFFLLAFSVAVIYMANKGRTSALNKRILAGSAIMLILASTIFLIYSFFAGWCSDSLFR